MNTNKAIVLILLTVLGAGSIQAMEQGSNSTDSEVIPAIVLTPAEILQIGVDHLPVCNQCAIDWLEPAARQITDLRVKIEACQYLYLIHYDKNNFAAALPYLNFLATQPFYPQIQKRAQDLLPSIELQAQLHEITNWRLS